MILMSILYWVSILTLAPYPFRLPLPISLAILYWSPHSDKQNFGFHEFIWGRFDVERVHGYYGLVMDLISLKKMLNVFESVSKRRDWDTTWENECVPWETQAARFEINGKSENIVF